MSLLICFIIMFGFFLNVTPSSTQSTSPSRPITSSASTYISVSRRAGSISPTPSPSPQNTCLAGPDTKEYQSVVIGTDKLYLDVSNTINCSGAVVSWEYCHYIIGFSNASSGLWPCVWRRSTSNDSEPGFENVGCNQFIVIPGDGERFRCRDYAPKNPAHVIEVEEGDYIGFYVPDSGLLPALSLPDDSQGLEQFLLVRNVTGFTANLKDSELRYVNPLSGSALLRARIDSDWVYPSTVPISSSATPPTSPEPTPPPTRPVTELDPQQPSQPATVASTDTIPLAVSLIIAIGVTVVLVITVISLITYVNCKPKSISRNKSASAATNDTELEYNDLYRFRHAHYVIGRSKQPVSVNTLNLRDNPAYDSRYLPHTPQPPAASTMAERGHFEHTYESLSDF